MLVFICLPVYTTVEVHITARCAWLKRHDPFRTTTLDVHVRFRMGVAPNMLRAAAPLRKTISLPGNRPFPGKHVFNNYRRSSARTIGPVAKRGNVAAQQFQD